MEPWHIIDVMAQGAASGLPPDLDLASQVVGGAQKDKTGSELIKLFCLPDSEGTPQTHPHEWAQCSSTTPSRTSRRCAQSS